jgi:hypothetical protein
MNKIDEETRTQTQGRKTNQKRMDNRALKQMIVAKKPQELE